jgi:methylmalonyl-CoA mutase C-terminal domain/subunit
VQALRAIDLDVPVVVGGIVPDADRPELEAAGVAAVLTPGASADEIVATVQGLVPA